MIESNGTTRCTITMCRFPLKLEQWVSRAYIRDLSILISSPYLTLFILLSREKKFRRGYPAAINR